MSYRLQGSSPRMRGTLFDAIFLRTYLGSSPRMRGTLAFDGPRRLLSGIIPAYAGNTIP